MKRQNKKQFARVAFGVVVTIVLLLAALGPITTTPVMAFFETFADGQDHSFSGAGSSFSNLTNIIGAPDSSTAHCGSGTGSGFYCQLWGTFASPVAGASYIHVYGFAFTGSSPVQLYVYDSTSSSYALVSADISGGGANQVIAVPTAGHSYSQIILEGDSGDTVNADAVSYSDLSASPTPTSSPTNTAPAPSATPSSAGLTTALISYWDFSTRLAPVFGGATFISSCSITTNSGGGIIGNADYLGPTSCLAHSDADPFRINPTGDWTWAGWVNPQDTTDGHLVVSKANTTSDAEYYLRWRTGGVYEFCWGGGSCLASTTSVSQNTWHFVAFGKSGTTAFIKVDNQPSDTATGTSGWQSIGYDFNFGAGVTTGHGMGIDEWGFWRSTTGNGGALTDAQLSSLWNGGSGCTYPFTACATGATPTVTPTPSFCGDSGSDNCIRNGNYENSFVGSWDGLTPGGGYPVDANVISSFNTGPAYCATHYATIQGNGLTQRMLLPAVPLFLNMELRRKHNNGISASVYPQIEIVKAGSPPGSVGEYFVAIDGKNGEFLPSGTSANFGWVQDHEAVHFLEPGPAYYDIHFYNVRWYPSVTFYDQFGDPHTQPSHWVLDNDDADAYQVDDLYLSTQGYKTYCPGGAGGPTATANATTVATTTPTRTSTATANATTSSTPAPTGTPAPATVFFNCDFEQGLTAWTGNNLSVQLAGGPVGPQFLRVTGSDGFARQPFFWPGGTAYFTFWVGPGSGGSVHITNQLAAIDDTLWSQTESTPVWKLIKAVLPNLAQGNYAFEVRGNDFVNMDFDGAIPAENGYSFCGSSDEITPTAGATSFVTPTPTPSATSGASPTSQTATAPFVPPTHTPNSTWTATVTAAPATGTPTASNTPTPANGATATSQAGTSTAAASVTQPTTTATSTGTPPTSTPSAMPNPTQQPEPAPNADCNRPDNPLNLAWWVDYEVCRVLTWFVWSPDNTQQMINIQATLEVYEPLGTLNELENARNIAQGEIQQYDWANTGLQGTTGLPDISILFPSTVPSGLLTGNLQLGPGAPNAYPFITACTLSTGQIFGDAMGKGLCATVNWLVDTGIMGWVQFLFDVAVWVAFMRYGWYVVVTKLPQIM